MPSESTLRDMRIDAILLSFATVCAAVIVAGFIILYFMGS